jgi:hypothetical protein
MLARSRARWLAVSACLVLVVSSPGSAGITGAVEVEPNDSFGESQILDGQAITTVTGDIADLVEDPDLSLPDSMLTAGGVLDRDVPNLSIADALEPFIAWIVPVDDAPPVTLLGSFAPNEQPPQDPPLDSNEDASPVATNPALQGSVNSDGTLRLKVTAAGDDDFDGDDDGTGQPHVEAGTFDLLVALGTLDLDYYSYRNLASQAGKNFKIRLKDTSDQFNSLVWFDESGVPIEYIFAEFPMCIGCDEGFEVQVPQSGILNFAVTGGEDDDADGFPSGADGEVRVGIGTGSYTLELEIVPEPSQTALGLASLIALAALARNRRYSAR